MITDMHLIVITARAFISGVGGRYSLMTFYRAGPTPSLKNAIFHGDKLDMNQLEIHGWNSTESSHFTLFDVN